MVFCTDVSSDSSYRERVFAISDVFFLVEEAPLVVFHATLFSHSVLEDME